MKFKNQFLKKLTIIKNFTTKICSSSIQAVENIKSDQTIMIGGFGLCGVPLNLVNALCLKQDLNNLHVVSTNGGTTNNGIGKLFIHNKVKRVSASYVGESKILEKLYFSGKIEIEFIPQGTLAEKIRCGGMGIPAFLTPTGVGTLVQDGHLPIKLDPNDLYGHPLIESKPKNSIVLNGKQYIVEKSIKADYSLVKAYKADTEGNLIFRKTARNFNADMAKNSYVIAEVEEIVEKGELDPDEIHIPGIFVKKIVKCEDKHKPLENIRIKGQKSRLDDPKKARIAKRAAEECKEGMYINLGIGIPNLITEFIPIDKNVLIHTENGMIGVGPYPEYGKEDPDLISAIKEAASEKKGCSYFSSSRSFGMIRGKHIDMTFLGGMEVDEEGDISNWVIPNKMIKGMGGAMDLVSSGGKVIAVMEHVNKDGQSKVKKVDKLPLTGRHVLNKLITDLGVFDYMDGKMILTEIYHDVSLEKIKSCTEANYIVSNNLRIIDY